MPVTLITIYKGLSTSIQRWSLILVSVLVETRGPFPFFFQGTSPTIHAQCSWVHKGQEDANIVKP